METGKGIVKSRYEAHVHFLAYYNCCVLQLWESLLSLKTPNDEGIAERWDKTVKAVIEDRVRNVCVILTLWILV